MSDSDDSDTFDRKGFQDIAEEIKTCKKNPKTSGMFVSGWDDADQDIDIVKNPKDNPIDHVLWAAENGELEILKDLLTSQPSLIHAVDADGYTPLHRAAYGDHVAVISYLLGAGVKIDARTQMGWTPLHSACNWNNYQAAARLLAGGADPASVSDGEQTPLHLASAISHCKSTLLVLFMRDDMVEIARQKNRSSETPEQLARSHGIYAPLFEMISPAVSYIRSPAHTFNPYWDLDENVN